MIEKKRKNSGVITNKEILIFSLFICAAVTASYFYADLPVALASRAVDMQIINIFQYITVLGDSTWPLVAAALLVLIFHFFWKKEQWVRWGIFVFSSVAVSGLATNLIKWLVGRWRPKAQFVEQLYGFDFLGLTYEQTSFPSGHATTVWALSLSLAVLFPRYRLLWFALAILVSMSRVVIGAHYLSDVIAGAYVAVITVIFIMRIPYFSVGQKSIAEIRRSGRS